MPMPSMVPNTLVSPPPSMRLEQLCSSNDKNNDSNPKGCDAWTWWIVGLFGCPASCCLSCLRAPWTWGLFMCFCALFSPLNVEGVYNEPSPCCNRNSLTSNLPSALCLFGRTCAVIPPVSSCLFLHPLARRSHNRWSTQVYPWRVRVGSTRPSLPSLHVDFG